MSGTAARRLLFLSALVLPILGGGAEAELPVLRPGERVSGTLTESDPTLEKGEHRDVYAVRLEAGRRLSMRLESEDFDTYLIFIHPDGTQIDNDDYVGLGSGLDVTVSGTGWGWIVPTSWAAEVSGEYTLSVD